MLHPSLEPLASKIPAFCDMDEDGGGWTVVIRRNDTKYQKYFYRKWDSYKLGFGYLKEEFYWGNDDFSRIYDCASYFRADWLYDRDMYNDDGDCTHCQLTGIYYEKGDSHYSCQGITWRDWKNSNPYSLKAVVMKIKPSDNA